MSKIAKFRHMFLRRFFNRLKPLLRFSEIWDWDYESCERCGACFKLAYTFRDDLWLVLYGSEDGCLCLNCALEKAINKGVFIAPADFEWLSLFYGDNGCFDIIKCKGRCCNEETEEKVMEQPNE